MKTISEHIRAHLLQTIETCTDPFSLDSLRRTEWSLHFEHLMRNRLIIGAFRYGLLNAKEKKQGDRIGRVRRELEAYVKDKNAEHLVDIANMMLLEFEEGDNHFTPTDDTLHTEEISY